MDNLESYDVWESPNGKNRIRWVYDCDYQTRGSYAYDTEAETVAAEDAEIAALDAGTSVALGCLTEKKCKACGHWEIVDALWGIVIEPDAAKLREFYAWQMPGSFRASA